MRLADHKTNKTCCPADVNIKFEGRSLKSEGTALLLEVVPHLTGMQAAITAFFEQHPFNIRYLTRPGLLAIKFSQLLFVFRSALDCLSCIGEVI